MQKDGHLRWLFALVAIVALSCMDVFTHAKESHFPKVREQSDTTNITDSTDTIIPVDTTDTIPVDTTDTIPVDTTDTIPVDTTDTIPVDTTDTIPVDTTDTIPVPVDLGEDSLLVYIPDSAMFMIPVTVKVTSHEDRTVQLGDGDSVAIDSTTVGWLLLPIRVYIDSVEYAVTGIAANAFRNCRGIAKVDIPPAVERVGDYAFYNDTSLNELLITGEDYQLTEIGRAAFAGTRLAEMPLSAGLLSIGDSAFAGCDSLRNMELNDSLKTIEASVFEGCTSLTSLTIPDGVFDIGRAAFAGSGLVEASLPDALVRMGDSIFADCRSLATVKLPDSLRLIRPSMFENCTSLTSLAIPDSVFSIGRAAFAGSGLVEMSLPAGLQRIGDSTFANCEHLSTLAFNDALLSIGSAGFKGCKALTQLQLPNQLMSVGARAFEQCQGLRYFVTGDSLRMLGDEVLSGDSSLFYVDLRKSRSLPLTEVDRNVGVFGGTPMPVIVYTPNGNDVATGVNVINTVARNITFSDGLNVAGTSLDAEASRKGIGTYLLNQYYGDTIFGQLLNCDSIRLNYPLPYSDCPKDVRKVDFVVQGSVRCERYVNNGDTLAIPSSSDLGIEAPVMACMYVDEEGVEQEFTSMTPVVGDMTVDVIIGFKPGDANYDGTVDVRDITALIDMIMGTEPSSFFVGNADLDNNNEIDVRDITALIDMIMDGGGEQPSATKEVKILCLGNSFTIDAMAYVPFILRTLAPQVRLKLGMLYDGGATLQNHYEYHFKDSLDYGYFYKYKGSDKWRNTKNYQLKKALDDEEWDIIMLQQGSAEARDYALYQPYLDSIIVCLNDTINHPFKIAWLSIPAYGEGYGPLNGSTSNEMFYDIMACTDSVMTQTKIDYLFPCGTAIQNARTTELDQLGRFYHLTYDGMHLQEGIPCVIEAYVVVQVLLNQLGIDVSIDDDLVNITEDWLQQNSIPQLGGQPVGMTPAYRELAKYCAKMAIKSPMEITDCSNFLAW